jgi:hypothetical protein
LKPLNQASNEDLVQLLNDRRVTKHMPLAETVDSEWVEQWKNNKSKLWSSPEHGPWAVYFHSDFAGWAGLQPDGDNEVELAIVLHVWAWRLGSDIANVVLEAWKAIEPTSQINVYFPTTRPIDLIAEKLGLRVIGKDELAGHTFVKFRLTANSRL